MEEVVDKVAKGQARVVLWDNIKDNHPRQLKVSPMAEIPYKSRAYRSILDLSFVLRLEDGGVIESVNVTTEKWAPRGAINRLGHFLKCIIHVFAEADDDAVILVAKWDIQDVFLAAQLPRRIPTTKRQVMHVARGILHGIHGVFPPSEDDAKTQSQQKATQRGRHIRNNKMPVWF